MHRSWSIIISCLQPLTWWSPSSRIRFYYWRRKKCILLAFCGPIIGSAALSEQKEIAVISIIILKRSSNINYDLQWRLIFTIKNFRKWRVIRYIQLGWDYSKLFLARVVLYALCHKKTEIIFLIKIFRFTPATKDLKNFKKTILTQQMKIIVRGCLIAQMKRLVALITAHKP